MTSTKIGNAFSALPWQVGPWDDKSIILLLTGSAGGGKSRLAAEKIHAFNLHYPGATTLIGRRDRTSAFRSVVPFMQNTVMRGTEWGRYISGVFNYSNGSQMWVVGLNGREQVEALRSIGKDGTVDMIWLEEATAIKEDDHMELLARLRGTAAPWVQLMYTTNPDDPAHWIKKLLIDKGQAKTYFSTASMNPYNPGHYIKTLDMLTGVKRTRLRDGLWVRAEGAIYTQYNAAVHLLGQKFDPPVEGRFIVSIDFGYTAPFSCGLWYVDYDGRAYLYREIYRSQTLVEELAKEIRAMTAGYPIEAWVCDHDAEGRATLEKHLGIRTTAAYKSVADGINAVAERLASDRLFFMPDAIYWGEEASGEDPELLRKRKPTNTIEEITGYVWAGNKHDTPKKENDHGMDMVRYFTMYLDHDATIKAEDFESMGHVQVERDYDPFGELE